MDTKYKQPGAYVITHVASGKIYIGSTNDVVGRVKRHLNELRLNKHPNLHLQRAYNKSPELTFYYIYTDTREQAYDYEQEYLDGHYEAGSLFNIAMDARTGVAKLTEESIAKIKEAVTGLKRSEETRERIRQAKLGVKRPASVAEKVRAANSGRIPSAETRLKMSLARKGKKMPPRTAEHIEKIRLAKLNYKVTAETAEKIRLNSANARSVSINGTIYPSVSEAVRQIKMDHKTIRRRLDSNQVEFQNWYYINQ